jgi:hypothetical protein
MYHSVRFFAGGLKSAFCVDKYYILECDAMQSGRSSETSGETLTHLQGQRYPSKQPVHALGIPDRFINNC